MQPNSNPGNNADLIQTLQGIVAAIQAAWGSGAVTLGFAELAATIGSITTTAVDLLTITINAPGNGRPIKLEYAGMFFSTVAGDFFAVSFQEGATVLHTETNRFGAASGQEYYKYSYQFTPTAGAHTYKVTIARTSGTGTISAYVPTANSKHQMIAAQV